MDPGQMYATQHFPVWLLQLQRVAANAANTKADPLAEGAAGEQATVRVVTSSQNRAENEEVANKAVLQSQEREKARTARALQKTRPPDRNLSDKCCRICNLQNAYIGVKSIFYPTNPYSIRMRTESKYVSYLKSV